MKTHKTFPWRRRFNDASLFFVLAFILLLGSVSPTLGAQGMGEKLPPEWRSLAGQRKTCAEKPRHRTFVLPAEEKILPVGMDLKAAFMTFAGEVPGPIIEVCEGDTVTLKVPNKGHVSHGLDTHAFRINAANYGPVDAGKTLTITKVVDTPGVFMYHCAAGPVTDLHIKEGMYSAMIVYPRKVSLRRAAREVAIVQGGLFGDPDDNGLIKSDSKRVAANDPFTATFNGRLEHDPLKVKPGDLVRVYFVNAGPGSSAVHVIGTILDRFYVSGNPRNVAYDVQTEVVPAGSGAMLEFRVPEKGTFLFVDHDNLRFIPTGFVIPIVAQ